MKQEKTTDDFEKDLKNMKDASELKRHFEQLDKIDAGRYLQQLMDEKGISVSMITKRIDTSASNIYKFINGEKKGSKDFMIRLACAVGMTVEETNCLLKYAGFSRLYAKDKRDALIIYGMEHNKNIDEIEELLIEHELEFRLY